MLTPNGLVLMCQVCEAYHVEIRSFFDGWQWWDHCPIGCGWTPHDSSCRGLVDTGPSEEDEEFDICPVPEV